MFDKLIDVILQFVHLFCFFFVVKEYEMTLVLRFGKKNRLAGPGFHWKWPFNIEVLLTDHITMGTMVIGPQSLTTKDDQSVVLSSVVTYKISDVEKLMLTASTWKDVLLDSAYGIQGKLVRENTWQDLLKMDMDSELLKKMRRRALKFGISVDEVQISDITRSKSLRLIQSTHDPDRHLV